MRIRKDFLIGRELKIMLKIRKDKLKIRIGVVKDTAPTS